MGRSLPHSILTCSSALCKVILDLSADKRLKAIFLEAESFDRSWLSRWALPSLYTLASDRLGRVTPSNCTTQEQKAIYPQLNALDQVLTEGPSGHTLRRVNIINGGNYATTPLGMLRVRTFLRKAFPKSFARKILYDHRDIPL